MLGLGSLVLVGMAETEDLSAMEALEKDRFVDDLLGGNETREGMNLQVNGTCYIG